MICIILKESVHVSKGIETQILSTICTNFNKKLYQLLSVFIQFGKNAEKNDTLKQA